MPELVAGGPIIPVSLLNELDSSKVVFFCGAGISAGTGSDLPTFAGLVQYIYKVNHLKPDAVEREALDCDEQVPERRRPNFDKAFELLERPERLGAQALRRSVIDCLSEDPTGPLKVHESLIALSETQLGVRLVTTNFDNRFIHAGLDDGLIDAAPKLPVPKPHNWASVVHLHGRIAPNDGGSNLVLTAADFGRAYLTERWAARFVTELFRDFTVVFVGYSVSDPVMSYLVDALAAERSKGARFAKAYAFAHHNGRNGDKLQARWRAKNVTPIVYDSRDSHRFLADTLIEWARIRQDPFYTRSRIALKEITKMPAGASDPTVQRVIWALQDPVAAKALADEPPVVDEDDFVKLERWLDMFTETGLLCCDAVDTNSGTASEQTSVIRLVDTGSRSWNPQTLDMTRAHLARWMARHLHVPQLLAWVLRNGGYLHPGLQSQVQEHLSSENSNIPPRLRLLWTVLLDNQLTGHRHYLWTSRRHAAAGTEAERRHIEDEVVASLSPRLVVRPRPSSWLQIERALQENPIEPIEACAHLKLMSGDGEIPHDVEEMLKQTEILSRHAENLTTYLEQALVLLDDGDSGNPDSYVYRPSIADHGQNGDQDDWMHLIDLARDSYLRLATSPSPATRRRAGNLLQRWVDADASLFTRLALHALTENNKSNIHVAKKLLLSGRKPGVWELELRREVLRFFRKAGSRLPRSLRAEIVRAIHKGPKGKSAEPELIRREKSLRLRKLSVSGARLDRKSQQLAEEATIAAGREDRNEFLSWHEFKWFSDYDFAPTNLVDGSVADIVLALRNEDINVDEFRGLVARRPVRTLQALRRLADREEWPVIYWEGFLWAFYSLQDRKPLYHRLQECIAGLFRIAPPDFFGEVGAGTAELVRDLAGKYNTDRESDLQELWKRIWDGTKEGRPKSVDVEDVLTYAMNRPAGKLAEAALTRLWKYEPRTRSGLPTAVVPYFEAIGSDTDGHLGRVILARRLYHLFAIDPEWTSRYLIARLDTDEFAEDNDLWSSYGWSATVSPDLLQAFKDPFLKILSNSRGGGRNRHKIVDLFMAVCMELPNVLTETEIRSVIDSMSEDDLNTVLSILKRRLKAKPEDLPTLWHKRVYPWLLAYWPRAGERNTASTTERMLGMLVNCEGAFEHAVDWSLHYLQPLQGHGLGHLLYSGYARRYPDAVLSVTDRLVDSNILPVHQRPRLLELLRMLSAANSDLLTDHRFKRLYSIATR